ncbi:hypothetical protein [Anaeromyxobacter sp. PSR-1]|uniref:hypothetical protein n=1 Tax=unclassified Anaeromyxobacter TaxID=2620896 RepID=UPI0005E27FA7|nr:hypothetical protein [Anaeromyxobacter sp. PSR-1]GAO05488.1 hypothetical protein PSR1_04402 [Anaeromyxobacter sp. PSR-1]
MTPGADGQVRRVSGEIDALRGELGMLVGELDRRRSELFDLGLQARRHPVAVAIAASAAALVIGGLVAMAVRARSERQRPSVRAREARRALARLLDHPQRVGAEPSVLRKAAAAAASTLAVALVRRAVVDRYLRPPPARAAPAGARAR